MQKQGLFEYDVFLSYARADDEPLRASRPGWVGEFVRALHVRLHQILGEEATIWFDKQSIRPGDAWDAAHEHAVTSSATILCIVSPAYLKSDHCVKELNAFLRNTELAEQRIFKVIKHPVPFAATLGPLSDIRGYQFYETDRSNGAIREFWPDAARPQFWQCLDDLVHHLAKTLERLHSQQIVEVPSPARATAENPVVRTSSRSNRQLCVFLCHSSADKASVRALCSRLRKDSVDSWLDEQKLLPGQKWQEAIPMAVKQSDAVLVCMSKGSINKAGYLQKEIGFALDVAQEQPEGAIFLIPARLEECDVPNRLREYQWVNLYEESGY